MERATCYFLCKPMLCPCSLFAAAPFVPFCMKMRVENPSPLFVINHYSRAGWLGCMALCSFDSNLVSFQTLDFTYILASDLGKVYSGFEIFIPYLIFNG